MRDLAVLVIAIAATLSTQARAVDLPMRQTLSSIAASPEAAAGSETSVEALRDDATHYASDYGLTLPEAMDQLTALAASVPFTDRLAAFHDRLAGVFVEHRPSLKIVVLLTGSDPLDEASARAASSPVPIEFRFGALANREQILAAIQQHQGEIGTAVGGLPGMGIDDRTGRLAVMIQANQLAAVETDELTSRLAAIAGVPVELKLWTALERNMRLEGGSRLNGSSAGDRRRYICTAGFVVTDGTRLGLSTAAHCPETLRVDDVDGGTLSLRAIGAWGARSQDVQIQEVSGPIAPTFHIDPARGLSRDVTTWRNRHSTRVGDYVCHYGERTGYSCSEIAFVDYAPGADLCAGPCPATWVVANGSSCHGGDSGGPVFIGTTALGIFKGGTYSDDGACAVYYYMSVDFLPSGWTVDYRKAG